MVSKIETYIKLNDAIDIIRQNGIYGSGYSDSERENDVIEMLESLPTYNFDNIGHWKSTTYTQCVGFKDGNPIYKPVLAHKCSECGKIAHAKHNFCKACGVKMEE